MKRCNIVRRKEYLKYDDIYVVISVVSVFMSY